MARALYNDLPPEAIAAALSYLDASDRELWVEMAMAVKTELGESGYDIWDTWARAASNHNASSARSVWKSVKPHGGVGIGTLIHHAKQAGFTLENVTTKRLTPEEITARAEQRQAEERAAEEARRARHEAVAIEASKIWNAATEADDHPYLKRKQVPAYGLRIGTWPNGMQALLVPIVDADGKLWSLQAIFANENPAIGRDKDYLAGGKKRGCFYTIGQPPSDGAQRIVLCEGYATAASIHRATGVFTALAFDSGNLKSIAYELRRRYPAAHIVIAADNDLWTVNAKQEPINPGMDAAIEIAELMPARVTIAAPEFAVDELGAKPTDWNDMHVIRGLDAVRTGIMQAFPANDNQEAKTLPLNTVMPPFGWPDTSDKGQPLNTVENLRHLMTAYGITARYNVIRKNVELLMPGRSYHADNRANVALSELNSICARNRMPQSMLADYIKLIADANAYNPVADWILSKPWDGRSRLDELFKTVQTSGDPKLRDLLIYRWLVSAVAAIFMPSGFESHGVLVFTGAQGQGKTKWIKRLLPDHLHDVVMVGAVLDPNNKDTVTNAISHWLVELGELDATFRKADIARLKSFITNATDKVRRPYDRIESEYQRRTVFFASVNEDRYLIDDTGNRRWWTVPVSGIDYQHNVDMQQLWAEIHTCWDMGEPHHLDPSELEQLNANNTEHEAIDPIEEQIKRAFDWEGMMPGRDMTATEVLLSIGYDKPTKGAATHASKILKKLTGKEPHKSNAGRFFRMPMMMRDKNF